ncbi:interferon alpha-inducible 27 2A isoform X1, partial [Paramuricea clavata]
MMFALAPTIAGGLVATLQSAGAAGLGSAGAAVVGAVGAAVGAAAGELRAGLLVDCSDVRTKQENTCMKKFSRKSFVLLICVSLILDWNGVLAVSCSDNKSTCCYEKGIFYCGSGAGLASGCLNGLKLSPWTVSAAVAGGVGAVVAAPVVLGAAGFTGAGIAAGSVASTLMSCWRPGAAAAKKIWLILDLTSGSKAQMFCSIRVNLTGLTGLAGHEKMRVNS